MQDSGSAPRREIIQAEALAWLREHPAPPRSSVITSLPDRTELPDHDFARWKAFFLEAARALIAWVPEAGLAMFFQSDIRYDGAWIDKGYLVMRVAEELDAQLVFHKIACRKPAGTITHGRSSYSHLIAVSRTRRGMPRHPGPDVLGDAGHQPWSRAMGVKACEAACRYLREETDTTLVVDPFCGHGTVLAVANAMGFDALGVDISARQCRAARKLKVEL